MIDVSLGFIVSSLPWWLAAPLVQLAVLVVGMALDETYVNRTTVLTAAIATHIHVFVAGEAGVLVSLYADAGLAVGAYGLYAYVVDGYVGTWFRLLAYYVYSPLSAFLVILTAGPTMFGVEPLFLPAVAAAGFANYRFREYLRPEQPFYFGPRTQEEFEAVLETETEAPPETGAETGDSPTETATAAQPTDAAAESTASDRAATGADPAASRAGATAAASSGAATETGRSGAQTTTSGRGAGADVGTDTGQSTAGAAGAGAADGAESAAADGGSTFDHPGAEPADADDSSERGILPKFMRRL